jgi:CheY-like chemotaxis protein
MADEHLGAGTLVHTPVLIVESNDESRAIVCVDLERAGYTTLEATTGIDAIVLLYIAKERLTVVVSIYLSDMNGEEFLQLVSHDPQLLSRHGYVFLSVPSATSAAMARFLAHNGIENVPKRHWQILTNVGK